MRRFSIQLICFIWFVVIRTRRLAVTTAAQYRDSAGVKSKFKRNSVRLSFDICPRKLTGNERLSAIHPQDMFNPNIGGIKQKNGNV